MFIKLVITLTFATLCSAAAAKDYYVSPSGSDSLNGLSPSINFWTKTGPFKTLTRARNAIRQLKAAGKFNEAITVHVGKGTYQLQSALEFDERDSGLPGQEILWEGEKGASIISGGSMLKNCQPYDSSNPNKVLSCPLNANTVINIKGENNHRIGGDAPKFELFVNDRRMHLARWPDKDWAHIAAPLDEKTYFRVFEKIPSFSGDLSSAQVHIFPGNDIYDHYASVKKVDLGNNQITLSSEAIYNLAGGRRFYLQNVEAALNTSEEWYYDQVNSEILFIPPSNIVPNNIAISSALNLLMLNDASRITFKNFTLKYSTGAAIRIHRSDNLLFDHLEINNIGGHAINAPDNTHITISNCNIHDIGYGGILLNGGDRPSLTSSNNVIDNNHISNFDAVLFGFSPAIDIQGVGARIIHNHIEKGNHSAIMLGGNDHIIERNEISQVCLQTGDCGAIYSGRDWTYRGNIIRYNYLHDFLGYELDIKNFQNIGSIIYRYSGARGIYLDDAASGFKVFGNILVNSGTMAMQIGGGRDNKIENNLIKINQLAILVDPRGGYFDWAIPRSSLTTMPIQSAIWSKKYPELSAPMLNDTWPEGNTIQRNIIITPGVSNVSIVRYWMPKQTNTIGNNLLWSANGNIKIDFGILETRASGGSATWEDWIKQGIETTSLIADPCINLVGNRINLTCINSPISKISFQALPNDIGLVN